MKRKNQALIDDHLGAASLKLPIRPARRRRRCLSLPPVAAFSSGNHPNTSTILCYICLSYVIIVSIVYDVIGVTVASPAASLSVCLGALYLATSGKRASFNFTYTFTVASSQCSFGIRFARFSGFERAVYPLAVFPPYGSARLCLA